MSRRDFKCWPSLCVCLDYTRCNAWVLDGDLYHKGLQGVAVPVGSIEDTLLLITVDMSRPWNALDSLQKWAAVAREHIDKLRVAPEKLRELEHKSESTEGRGSEGSGFYRSMSYLKFYLKNVSECAHVSNVDLTFFYMVFSCKTVSGVHRAGQRRGRHATEEEWRGGRRAAAVRGQHSHTQPRNTGGGCLHKGTNFPKCVLVRRSFWKPTNLTVESSNKTGQMFSQRRFYGLA